MLHHMLQQLHLLCLISCDRPYWQKSPYLKHPPRFQLQLILLHWLLKASLDTQPSAHAVTPGKTYQYLQKNHLQRLYHLPILFLLRTYRIQSSVSIYRMDHLGISYCTQVWIYWIGRIRLSTCTFEPGNGMQTTTYKRQQATRTQYW